MSFSLGSLVFGKKPARELVSVLETRTNCPAGKEGQGASAKRGADFLLWRFFPDACDRGLDLFLLERFRLPYLDYSFVFSSFLELCLADGLLGLWSLLSAGHRIVFLEFPTGNGQAS